MPASPSVACNACRRFKVRYEELCREGKNDVNLFLSSGAQLHLLISSRSVNKALFWPRIGSSTSHASTSQSEKYRTDRLTRGESWYLTVGFGKEIEYSTKQTGSSVYSPARKCIGLYVLLRDPSCFDASKLSLIGRAHLLDCPQRPWS